MKISEGSVKLLDEYIVQRIKTRRLIRRIGYASLIVSVIGCSLLVYTIIINSIDGKSINIFLNIMAFLVNFGLFIKSLFDIFQGPYEYYMLFERPVGYSFDNEKHTAKGGRGRWTHEKILDDIHGCSYSAFTFSRKSDAAMFKVFFYE